MNRCAGTAIFMALLIIAIVTSVTVVLVRMQQIDIQRTQMMFTSEQAYLYGQGIINWAQSVILSNIKKPNLKTQWPVILPPTPLPQGEGSIAGQIQVAEGLINLNNFAMIGDAPTQPKTPNDPNQANVISAENPDEPNDKTIFIKLLKTLNVPLSAEQVQNVIKAISAWQQVGSSGNLNDSFDAQYANMSPPYRASHFFMVSPSELRLVLGMTPKVYQQLLPYVITLPGKTAINTRYSPPAILNAMGLDPAKVQNPNADDVSQEEGKYYLVRGDVYLADQHLTLYALLVKQTESAMVLWQSFGTL